jgi:HEAT repeat protein
LNIFSGIWPSIQASDKAELLKTLTEMAEDNVELDFTEVFMISMRDSDEWVRESAVRGLWECEDRSLIRPLARMLSTDVSYGARAAAAMALKRFAERAKYGKLINRDVSKVREALMGAIVRTGENSEVIRRSLESVGFFEGDDVDDAIASAYSDSDPLLRQSALYAMGGSNHIGWISTLTEAIHDSDAAVRYEAAGALGRLGEESSESHLIPLLKDDDVQVQIAAATALGSVGGQLGKSALLACLDTGEASLEQAVRSALAELEFEDDPLGIRFER